MKYQHIIIDATNLWWRSFVVSIKDCITTDETKLASCAIDHTLKMLRNLQKKFAYNSSDIYLLFDNPETVLHIRKLIDSEYKSTRLKKSVPKGIYEALAIFVEILKSYSNKFHVIKVPSLEADDLTDPLIKQLQIDENNKALLISNDLDWARNITEDVDWYNYNEIYTITSFNKKFGFDPSKGKAIQLYKAIHGDKSDNITNAVPYIPTEILLQIVNQFESVDDLYFNLWKECCIVPRQWKLKLQEAENDVRKNFTLVDFVILDIELRQYIIDCKRNVKLLKIYFESLELPLESDMTNKINRQTFFIQKRPRRL